MLLSCVAMNSCCLFSADRQVWSFSLIYILSNATVPCHYSWMTDQWSSFTCAFVSTTQCADAVVFPWSCLFIQLMQCHAPCALKVLYEIHQSIGLLEHTWKRTCVRTDKQSNDVKSGKQLILGYSCVGIVWIWQWCYWRKLIVWPKTHSMHWGGQWRSIVQLVVSFCAVILQHASFQQSAVDALLSGLLRRQMTR